MHFTDNPEDQRARAVLAAELRSHRQFAGMTQMAVAAACGLTHSQISVIETRPGNISRFRAYTSFANGLDLRFLPHATGGMFDGTPAVQPILDRDEFVQYAEMQRIVNARRRTIKAALVAERMGVGEMTIFKLEQLDRDDPSVAVWQSYVRSIGGRLDLVLAPFEDAVAA